MFSILIENIYILNNDINKLKTHITINSDEIN